MKSAPPEESQRFLRRLYIVLVLLGLAVALPIVALGIYLERRFDSFEHDLHYATPDTSASIATGELPLNVVRGQTVYVPAYSHIYHQRGRPLLLTITLSVRNTDPEDEILVASVRYFDGQGREVRSYLEQAKRLGPLASVEFLVERSDTSGGSGASFLVTWAAATPVSNPVIEAVMIDTAQQQGISFVRRATVVSEDGPTNEGD